MKTKFIYFLLVVILVSCTKESQEKTLQDYIGKYKVESTLIRLQYNDFGYCYGDDTISHPIDSNLYNAPDFYLDTIYKTDTLEIFKSQDSEKELVVSSPLGFNENLYFYNPPNTTEFKFIRMNEDDRNPFKSAYNRSILKDNEILFDFEIYGDFTTFTYFGTAEKVD